MSFRYEFELKIMYLHHLHVYKNKYKHIKGIILEVYCVMGILWASGSRQSIQQLLFYYLDPNDSS